MFVAAQYIPVAYSLSAVGIWGTSDFLGGVGARRANAFLFTAIVHLSGMVAVGALALLTHAVVSGKLQPGLGVTRRGVRRFSSSAVLSRARQGKYGTDRARRGGAERRHPYDR